MRTLVNLPDFISKRMVPSFPEGTIIGIFEDTGDFSGCLIPKGTRGTVVECYNDPQEGYAVDLAILDPSLVSGFDYDNVILYPEQFVVDEENNQVTESK